MLSESVDSILHPSEFGTSRGGGWGEEGKTDTGIGQMEIGVSSLLLIKARLTNKV